MLFVYSLAKNYNENKRFLIFTLDGSGDKGINCTVSTFSNKKLKRLFEIKFYFGTNLSTHNFITWYEVGRA